MSKQTNYKDGIRQDIDGAQQSSAHTHDVVSPTIATPPTISPPAAEQLLLRRIEKFLDFYGLSPTGKSVGLMWIKSIGTDVKGEYARVRTWLLGQLNAFARGGGGPGSASAPRLSDGISSWQRGCPEIIPGLRSKAFWEARDVPWIEDFEKGFHDIREELLALRGRGVFQPYRAPGYYTRRRAADGIGGHCHDDGGDWNIFYLFLHNVDFAQNRSMCPKTCALVKTLPHHYHHAFFSALTPGTHIIKHNGPTNKKLRVHLPLIAPGGGLSRLRVGSETRETCAGRALVFDDSFEHEAWNDGDEDGRSSDMIGGSGTERLGVSRVTLGRSRDGTAEEQEKEENIQIRDEGSSAVLSEEEIVEESRSIEDAPQGAEDRDARGHHGGGNGDGRDWRSYRGTVKEGRPGEEGLKAKPAPRITLVADVWHPDLTKGEIGFLSFLQLAELRLEKRLVEMEARRSANAAAVSTDLRLPERCCLSSDGECGQTGPQRPPQEREAIMPRSTVSNDEREQHCCSCCRRGREKASRGREVTVTDEGGERAASPVGKTSKDSDATPLSVVETQEDFSGMRVRSCSCNGETGMECSTAKGGEKWEGNRGFDTLKGSALEGNTQGQGVECRNLWSAAAAKSFLGVITRAKQLRADDSRVFGETSSNGDG